MHPIIYDVAVSLDGYISGPSEDISKFAHDGPVVDDYHARMAHYGTAIMGRKTYEFGYAFGLQRGQNPYPQMETIVFSQTLECPENAEISVRSRASVREFDRLKKEARALIYLCGGGEFAGWLLEHGLIDRVFLKRAPIILGNGVSLFGKKCSDVNLSRVGTKPYDSGYLLEELVP
ncbi:MAG: dihydrofolate reductase family protein [Paracoccaceae bacterium]